VVLNTNYSCAVLMYSDSWLYVKITCTDLSISLEYARTRNGKIKPQIVSFYVITSIKHRIFVIVNGLVFELLLCNIANGYVASALLKDLQLISMTLLEDDRNLQSY
jgi:hypothetical protein